MTRGPRPLRSRYLAPLLATSVAACLLCAGAVAEAQSYRIDAGSSTLFNADGGTVEVRSGNSSMQISAGRLHGRFALGALFEQQRGDVVFGVGDSRAEFDLPSDLFGGARNLQLRGARIERKRGGARVLGFAGVSTTTVGAPFFYGGRADAPLGLLFADQPLGSRWRLVSRNAFSKQQTSIQTVEWRPRQPLTFSLGGGIGSNKFFGATSATANYSWVTAKAVYASHPAGFRRIELDSPMASEFQRENISIVLRPSSRLRASVARQNLVQDEGPDRPAAEVSVNEVGASLNVGVRLTGNFFQSSGAGRNSLGGSLSAAHRVTRAVDLSVDASRYVPQDGEASDTVGITARQSLTARLSLLQVATFANGSPSFHVGGEFLSNPLSVSVSHQTIYAPLRIGNPFVQVVGVDLRIHGPWDLELRAGTYATPDGSLKYTISARQFLSGNRGDKQLRHSFPRYLIRGIVVDAEGRPVEGAVLQVGREIVITNRTGQFSLRTEKPAPLPLDVMVDEFLTPGRFEVADAPAAISPASGDDGPEIRVVVARRH